MTTAAPRSTVTGPAATRWISVESAADLLGMTSPALRKALESKGRDTRNGFLLYEATEGGAGVLTRIVAEPQTIAEVALEALRIMHFRVDALPPDASGLADVSEGRRALPPATSASCRTTTSRTTS